MNENQNFLKELHIRLMAGDEHARLYACREVLELIRNNADISFRLQLQSLILPFLVDLKLYADAISCMESLLTHGEYRQKLLSLHFKSKMHQDIGEFNICGKSQ